MAKVSKVDAQNGVRKYKWKILIKREEVTNFGTDVQCLYRDRLFIPDVNKI
jgi:hypothetical protein